MKTVMTEVIERNSKMRWKETVHAFETHKSLYLNIFFVWCWYSYYHFNSLPLKVRAKLFTVQSTLPVIDSRTVCFTHFWINRLMNSGLFRRLNCFCVLFNWWTTLTDNKLNFRGCLQNTKMTNKKTFIWKSYCDDNDGKKEHKIYIHWLLTFVDFWTLTCSTDLKIWKKCSCCVKFKF